MAYLISNPQFNMKHFIYHFTCMFCFPISDHVMPSWEFAFCSFY